MLHHKVTPESPIGIFDSGIGGLTVVKAIRAALPSERLIYFGDTARVPYGPKSQITIRKYAADDTAILMRYQPKLIIVACNTVSALALDVVEKSCSGIPVIGVLKAGAELAVQVTGNNRIGVIGTQATVCSNAYAREINLLNEESAVVSKACPLFVPLAEEGFIDHPATKLIAGEYLAEIRKHDIDTLVLGCTHYPILKRVIADIVGPGIRIIDSAEAVALKTKELLTESALLNAAATPSVPHLLVSDLPQKFSQLYQLFMGSELPDVELVEV
ncbi:glutamate racemase [Chlorobium ferrooxidans]|uniref:Glutamate racemase n=1 Tax=Chlorobium ferrooxidans DSM 13031 TaxID=377431 RepID=Q0YRX3_9CHLB|nr:glutamate racemase [Chlorobium ferrooxidans]EAT59015.1 Glutamate racemase [Chlorobium ferrooxidans DSM 13031]